MAQNFRSIYFSNNNVVTLFEAPTTLMRVFLGIYIVAGGTTFGAHISFDDPKFVNFIVLNNLKSGYEFECADIPQGIVFIQKQDGVNGSISAIEILK